jgi:hypothetical protein
MIRGSGFDSGLFASYRLAARASDPNESLKKTAIVS